MTRRNSRSTGTPCRRKETVPPDICGSTAARCCGSSVYAWWIYLRRGFEVIQGCNPPDDIFLVALPFKLFGVKYIFDHHDANPELYLSKYREARILLQSAGLAGEDDVSLQRCRHVHQPSYKELAMTARRSGSGRRIRRAQRPGFGHVQAGFPQVRTEVRQALSGRATSAI